MATDQETAAPPPAPDSLPEFVGSLTTDVTRLGKELAEIDMLISQATAEAGRHEQKRAQLAERLAGMSDARTADSGQLNELYQQLVTLTRRAAVMEAQVDVLAGKSKVLTRFRDSIAEHAAVLSQLAEGGAASQAADADGRPAFTRALLGAQEDLRREIARAMHDGPAQSLTNIVLQAQIVERLLARDPAGAEAEVHQLISMVQQTLEATKTFIFDVRPMVLDDLGLVPTLRRAARERGRRAQIPVLFESLGTDRRLPMELESGLFRILDAALGAYLAGYPERVWVRLDWSDQIDARMGSVSEAAPEQPPEPEAATKGKGRDKKGGELLPALAAMMEDRKADEAARVEAARVAANVVLPESAWHEIQQRAATLGVTAELLREGTELHLVASAPEAT